MQEMMFKDEIEHAHIKEFVCRQCKKYTGRNKKTVRWDDERSCYCCESCGKVDYKRTRIEGEK